MSRNYNIQRQQGQPGSNNFGQQFGQSAAASAPSVASDASLASTASTDNVSSAAATTNDANTGTSVATSLALGSTTASIDVASATTATQTSTAASNTGAASSTSAAQSTASEAAASASSASASSTPTTLKTSASASDHTSSASSHGSAASLSLTSSSTHIPAASEAAAASPTSSSGSLIPLSNAGTHHKGTSTGTIAAAVVVPLILALAAVLLGFFCLRRRARRNAAANNNNPAALPAFMAPMREKRSADPVVTSERNGAYFTGLDTSARTSEGEQGREYYAPRSSEDPPPPYKSKSMASSGSANPEDLALPAAAAFAAVPRVHEPEHSRSHSGEALISPFADPVTADDASETSTLREHPHLPYRDAYNDSLIVSPIARPNTSTSRAPSQRSARSAGAFSMNRSINSDAYSDTASLHSAQAARMSVGGANVLHLRDSRGSGEDEGNPFHDVHGEEDDGAHVVSPIAEDAGFNWGGLGRGASGRSGRSGVSGL